MCLDAHHVVGAAVGLARDDRDLRHGGLGVGEQQLGAVLDQAAILLRGARQEARHVDEGDDRDVEAVAEAHEARGLARGVAVEHAGQHHRLVGDDADRAAFHAGEAGDDVLGEALLDLEEVALVDDLQDQLLHVVGLVRVVGDQRVERAVLAVGAVEASAARARPTCCWSGRKSIRRRICSSASTSFSKAPSAIDGLGGVDLGAAELFGRHRLVGHGLHHVGAGDEHVARVLHHEDEVGHGGRIDVAARARAHDDGDLRDDARGQHVAQEHLAVAAERGDALLDARAAGIEQADDRRAVLQRHVLDLGDLLRRGVSDSEPPNTVKSLAKT